MCKACIDRSDSLIFQHKRRPRVIGFTYASSEVHFRSNESHTFYRSIMTADERHDRPSGWFSKSQGLSAGVSFLSSPPLLALLLPAFFARSCSSFSVPKPHRNACYAGYFSVGSLAVHPCCIH